MLMVELVTPLSVAPVAWPLPHGDGRVPNVDVELAAVDAPPGTVPETTPAAVSAMSISAAPAALVPLILAMAEPPVRTTRMLRLPPQNPDPVPCVAAPYPSDIQEGGRPVYRRDSNRARASTRPVVVRRAAAPAIR